MSRIVLFFMSNAWGKSALIVLFNIIIIASSFFAGVRHEKKSNEIKELYIANKQLSEQNKRLQELQNANNNTMQSYYNNLQTMTDKYRNLKNEATINNANLIACRLSNEQLRIIRSSATSSKMSYNSTAGINAADADRTADNLMQLVPQYAEQYFICANRLLKLQDVIKNYNN